jgi:hypothetical protein
MPKVERSYPELDKLDKEFLRALGADKKSKARKAMLWYQGIEFDRDSTKPSATCRGHELLNYMKISETDEVPGQKFPKGKTPPEVCTELISKNAGDWNGPYQINFRYDRDSKGVWSGGYTIETSAQHRDIVAGRRDFDKAIEEALRADWKKDIQQRMLSWGSDNDDPGPKRLTRRESGSERVDATGELKEAWDELIEYLKSSGVRDVYSARFKLTKPTGRLRDGDSAEVFYSLK